MLSMTPHLFGPLSLLLMLGVVESRGREAAVPHVKRGQRVAMGLAKKSRLLKEIEACPGEGQPITFNAIARGDYEQGVRYRSLVEDGGGSHDRCPVTGGPFHYADDGTTLSRSQRKRLGRSKWSARGRRCHYVSNRLKCAFRLVNRARYCVSFTAKSGLFTMLAQPARYTGERFKRLDGDIKVLCLTWSLLSRFLVHLDEGGLALTCG